MSWLGKLNSPKRSFYAIITWGFLGALIGVIGGLLGAVFHHALHFVTHIRAEHNQIIFLLPLGGVLTVAIYHAAHMRSNRGTNEIIDAALTGNSLSPLIAPVIFISTAITHLFGGSAGREGAALQLGGSTASLLAKWLHLSRSEHKVLVMSGMSAVFAGLFGTPLTACLFTLEFGYVGTIFSPALLPCYFSALVASRISHSLGVHAETFIIDHAVSVDIGNVWKFVLLAGMISLLGIAMCHIFHSAEHIARHLLPNPYLRVVAGAAVVVAMTLAVGDHRFNGAGMDMALAAVGGNAEWYYFLLKMLFTAVTLAAGFKGGEIVPTFCIGATFGCIFGGLIGLDPGIAAALGLVGLFCCATNSPLASIILSIEMFGSANLHLFTLTCVIALVLSGNGGLYASQIIQFPNMAFAENYASSLKNDNTAGSSEQIW